MLLVVDERHWIRHHHRRKGVRNPRRKRSAKKVSKWLGDTQIGDAGPEHLKGRTAFTGNGDRMLQIQRTVATYAIAILSALLLLGGIGLVWLGDILATVDAVLLLLGSVAALVYLGVRLPAAWTGAVVFLLVSIAASGLLAFGGTALVFAPVAMPAILALFSFATFFCLVSMRPPPQHDMPEGPWPLAGFIRTLVVLALLLLAGKALLKVGCSFSVHHAMLIEQLGGLVAIVDAMLLLIGSVASLVYLVARVPAARRGALASFLISMASSGLLVVLVIASVLEIRRRGCGFAGMEDLVGIARCVALVVLALLTLWAFFCVSSIRPRGK